ncbi:hypothetical protein CJF42_09720 [Pseudoalteromonas sp. NBT06-2]|uniref:hypothetical protein n=1 Tax=Pseudoalteromonas sp. NBT06-2 TaxID=2025950 RepID=UPI000BA7539F|nr:hypothetical protein [Pseudoalteromonas sp. NBT06-2]PAJ74589.1 hypothetical protein CJF42_09720 [Pseudoalteromonas sp. NBT06-2]
MLVVACMDVGTRAMQEHIAGPSFFKGVTINAKMRLDHELLSSPEPHILKWLGYIRLVIIKSLIILLLYEYSFKKLTK